MNSDKGKFQKFNSDKFFLSDLDKELLAAENFLNKNTEEILKSTNSYYRTINSSSNIISDTDKENTFQTNPEKRKKVDGDLLRYQKQLKNFGFPELGNFYFPSSNSEDKEKTLRFFDFLILKKSTENEEKMKYKKQIEMLSDKISSLQNDNTKIEKEIMSLSEEIKKVNKEKKDSESKLNKIKEISEKQITELKILNSKLSNKNNAIVIEKKAIEEKFNKISENYQKIINKNNNINLSIKASNHIDMIENLKRNDVIKMLAKVNGTEKLIETFKNGFNESLRELLFEISALKNFIYEIHQDLIELITNKKFKPLEYNVLSLPFLDTVHKIKIIFRKNFDTVRKNMGNNIFRVEDLEGLNINTNTNTCIIDKNKNSFTPKNSSKSNKHEESVNISLKQDRNNSENIFETFEEEIDGNCYKGRERNQDENSEEKDSTSLNSSNNRQNLNSIKNEDNDYENELEFLKNKWIKTLMSIKNEKEEEN